MNEETKEILDDLNKTADNCVFIVCRSQEELDQMPRYTSNFMSINDRQAKILLKYIEDLQQKVEQLEKELTLMVENDERNQETIIKQSKRIKQLENIRKEIKEYIEKNAACFKNGDMLVELNVDDLLNILNKGSESNV